MMKYIFFTITFFAFNYCCVLKSPFHSKPNIVILILARGGSKGIPLKNLAVLNNVSLIRRSLNTVQPLLLQKTVQSVWVSTDHEIIAQEALDAGANIYWRDPRFASDSATSILAIQEFMMAHSDIDFVILVQCTSPFLKTEYVSKALTILATFDYDLQCIFSVTRTHKLRWTEFRDYIVPANFDINSRPRRQDWRGELEENGMFYLTERKLIEKGLLQDHGCSFVEIPGKDSMEIDSLWDLQLAQQILNIS